MTKARLSLSDHFNAGRLLRFSFPSIVMMVFTSIYGVVDGFFVSNYVGETPFAAINLIMPFLMIFSGIGFMIGTGGSALVSKTLGEGDRKRANELFSLMIAATVVSGAAVTVLGEIFLPDVAILLQANEEMLPYCVRYGRIILLGLIPFMLQNTFQAFFVTAEKPKLGLYVTVLAGVTNMVADALFVGLFRWGVIGAALATVLSQVVGGVIPFLYFAFPNSGLLRFTRMHFDGKALFKACTNGSSELMSNISMSLVNMLYNIQLMKYLGEAGVAAFGVIMYVTFVFISIFLGYTIGTAPIIGFHYGAGNREELHGILRNSLWIMAAGILLMTGLSESLSTVMCGMFVGYNEELLILTTHAFRLYCLHFLLAGFNIFASSFFTALNNGLVSAVISFLRTLVFQVAAILLLPLIIGADGIWLAVDAAEFFAFTVSVFFLVKMRKRYGY
ncbi:MAG: MATE family efflux transporter [Clostridia bacterium]|nr:MATE family efflux transporter [Clostridia bacterium]